MKTPDFMSYDRYKKKKKDTKKDGLIIGITTFFITLLLFTVIAKSLSPDVDVTIGGDSETDAKDTGLGVKRFIDDRLKMIQMEDNSAGVSVKDEDPNKKTPNYNDASFDKFSQQQLEEKVNVPTKNSNADSEDIQEEPIQPVVHTPPRPTARPVSQDLSTPYASPKMTKVYVGRYANIEQAKVAQGILMDSGLNITPFIKNMGGSYTLQVGSYSTRAKADGLASELLQNNFPARVVQE